MYRFENRCVCGGGRTGGVGIVSFVVSAACAFFLTHSFEPLLALVAKVGQLGLGLLALLGQVALQLLLLV
jgi:hypothetical protein